MLRKRLIIAAIGFALAGAPAASRTTLAAPRNAPATTINCLLASNAFAQRENDPAKKTLAHETLLFYLGRLDARTSPAQLKAEFQLAVDGLKGANGVLLMNECLREVRAKAQILQSVGQLRPGK